MPISTTHFDRLLQAVRRGMTTLFLKSDGSQVELSGDPDETVAAMNADPGIVGVLSAPRSADPTDPRLRQHVAAVSRRQFLRTVGAGTVTVFAAPLLLDHVPLSILPTPLTGATARAQDIRNAQREAIVDYALNTAEGRHVLAEAMVEPVKSTLAYEAIGRRLLWVEVDALPVGAIARYERDVRVPSYRVPRHVA